MNLDDAKQLAMQFLEQNRLQNWSFRFDRAKKRFGLCNYTTKTISLSASLVELNTKSNVQKVILHEIAHALAGPKAGHGPQWKKIVQHIGGVPERCYGTSIQTPLLQYTATCPHCTMKVQRKTIRKLACKSCCTKFSEGKWDTRFELIFSVNEK